MSKRRFHTEGQILKAIDAARNRAINYSALAERHEGEAKKLFVYAHKIESEGASADQVIEQQNAGKYELEQMEHCRKNSDRIMRKVIPRLGEKLSVFRTDTLPLGDVKLQAHDIPA